jgi:hypothetical protein
VNFDELLGKDVVFAEHIEQHDTHGVHVNAEVVLILLARELLGGCVERCSDACGKARDLFERTFILLLRLDLWLRLLRLILHSQTKVSKSRVFVFIQKNVVRLNVPVDQAVILKVVHSLTNLFENLPLGLHALVFWIFHQKIQKVLAFTVLHLNVKDLDAHLFFLLLI